MKRPEKFALKRWLYANTVTGLRVAQRPRTDDDWDILWVLTAAVGETRTVPDEHARDLVAVKPDHSAVLRLRPEIVAEVRAYLEYLRDNEAEHKEYLRLKKKFETD